MHPDRILIEPSGVGKLSDIVTAVEQASDGERHDQQRSAPWWTRAKCKMYMQQLRRIFQQPGRIRRRASSSPAPQASKRKSWPSASRCCANRIPGAVIITTPWDELSGAQILEAMEKRDTLTAALDE